MKRAAQGIAAGPGINRPRIDRYPLGINRPRADRLDTGGGTSLGSARARTRVLRAAILSAFAGVARDGVRPGSTEFDRIGGGLMRPRAERLGSGGRTTLGPTRALAVSTLALFITDARPLHLDARPLRLDARFRDSRDPEALGGQHPLRAIRHRRIARHGRRGALLEPAGDRRRSLEADRLPDSRLHMDPGCPDRRRRHPRDRGTAGTGAGPGALLFFDSDLDPLFDPVERNEALVGVETPPLRIKFGVNYIGSLGPVAQLIYGSNSGDAQHSFKWIRVRRRIPWASASSCESLWIRLRRRNPSVPPGRQILWICLR